MLGQSQIIWNIFFKYIFWIIPEAIISICIISGLYFTDVFASILATQEVASKHGIKDYSVDEEHSKIKDLSTLTKMDKVEIDETLLVLKVDEDDEHDEHGEHGEHDEHENTKIEEVNEPSEH
jgi:hypothetical protein